MKSLDQNGPKITHLLIQADENEPYLRKKKWFRLELLSGTGFLGRTPPFQGYFRETCGSR